MSRKFTYEFVKSYIEETGCKLLSKDYTDIFNDLEIQCKCSKIFYVSFKSFKDNNQIQCKDCSGHHNDGLSYEQVKYFIEIESNSGCKLISPVYINCKEKIIIKCKCGNNFETIYTKFISQNKRQCNECGNKSTSDKLSKSHDLFIKEVYNLVGNEYEVLSIYKGNKTKVKIKHKKCGYEYFATPDIFLSGSRCPKCASNCKISHEEFINMISNKYNNEFEVISQYINSKTNIKIKHSICGFEYDINPRSLINTNHNCIWCSGYYQDTERFKSWIYDNCKDEYELMDEYIKATLPIKIKHNKCGHEFNITFTRSLPPL